MGDKKNMDQAIWDEFREACMNRGAGWIPFKYDEMGPLTAIAWKETIEWACGDTGTSEYEWKDVCKAQVKHIEQLTEALRMCQEQQARDYKLVSELSGGSPKS